MTVEWELPENYKAFSEEQMKALSLMDRSTAAIGLMASLLMIRLAYRDRHRIYHRLILGLSVHMALFSLWHLYGAAAIPKDYPNAWGNHGTVATCTAQGFGLQVALVAPFYYVGLSLYSYFAVRNNFRVQQYLWIEKYIHIGVHIFPLASAVYLLQQDAYNYGGNSYICYIHSLPYDCGNHADVECVRGPQNEELLGTLLVLSPTAMILLIPTCVMMALYFEVRRKQGKFVMPASTVAQQAAWYLLAVWFSAILFMIATSLTWMGQNDFVTFLISSFNLNLFNVWILLVYLKFRVPTTGRPRSATRTIASVQSAKEETAPPHSAANPPSVMPAATTSNMTHPRYPEMELTFNIFDGTNAQGEFADYIHDGDSEDERLDQAESMRWARIQEHV